VRGPSDEREPRCLYCQATTINAHDYNSECIQYLGAEVAALGKLVDQLLKLPIVVSPRRATMPSSKEATMPKTSRAGNKKATTRTATKAPVKKKAAAKKTGTAISGRRAKSNTNE
jgi:hypothetical protein